MAEKAKSAIEQITVNEGTFENEVFSPNYINFFYVKNGSDKLQSAVRLKAEQGLNGPKESLRLIIISIYTTNAARNLNTEEAENKRRLEEIEVQIKLLGKSSTTIQAAIDGSNTLLHDYGFESFFSMLNALLSSSWCSIDRPQIGETEDQHPAHPDHHRVH